MPRSEFALPVRRRVEFLNRDAQVDLIRSHTALVRSDPSHLKVLEVIGIGGVGKTRLLAELSTEAHDAGAQQTLVWVNLGASASTSEIGAMRAIRDQVQIDCLLFDAALLTYWTVTGQPFHVQRSRGVGAGFAFRSVEAGGVAAGIPVPLTFGRDVYHALERRVAKRRYTQDEFVAIDGLRRDPDQILRRLPHYLGLDIARELEATGYAFLGFYDAYEKQAGIVLEQKSRWLQEFVGTLDRGLHVIATREALGWRPEDWGHLVDTVTLGKLPEAESRALVRSLLGNLDESLEDALLKASGLIPFFLEASIEAYTSLRDANDSVVLSDLPSTPADSVTRLLDHLGEAERHLAVALASVQLFDSTLAMRLVREMNLPISVARLDELLRWFFVDRLGEKTYRCHDLLTDFVRSSTRFESIRAEALQIATDYIDVDSLAGLEERADWVISLFRSVADGWAEISDPPTASVEKLVDAGYRLYDAGYWDELVAIGRSDTARRGSPVGVAANFLGALASRRSEGVDAALRQLEDVEPAVEVLGRHRESFRLEIAYLGEIAGDYSTARHVFRELNEQAAPFNASDRNHLRARLYHADMLMMDGRLLDSSRLLVETYELLGSRSPLEWAELVRQRGHALRFAFLLDGAERLYMQALRSTRAPSLQGKLHTNLAETLCWESPQRALDAAEISIEVNSRLGNRVEIAKCDAARGVAFAKLQEYSAARSAATRSEQGARDIGYVAGIAMALQAQTVIETYAGDLDGAGLHRTELKRLTHRLGTYGHLRAAPAWLARGYADFVDVAADVQWIGPDSLEDRLSGALSP